MVLGYSNVSGTNFNAFITYSLSIIVNIVLLYDLLKSENQRQTKQSKMKNLVLICFILSMIISISLFIFNIALYLLIVQPSYKQELILLFRISDISGDICEFFYLSLIGYFLKYKYETTYNHPFFRVNKLYINIFFVIYVIFTFIPHVLSIWASGLSDSKWDKIQSISWIIWGVISSIYNIIIVILFNIKLRKFQTLTMNNDRKLSRNVNKRLSKFVSEQTKLIIIMINILIFAVTFVLWSWYGYSDGLLSYIWHWAYFISYSIVNTCLLLTVNRSCKICKICSKRSNIVDDNELNRRLLSSNHPEEHHKIQAQVFEIEDICFEGQDCKILEIVCLLLKEYNNNKDVVKFMDSTNYSLFQLMDDFSHLLMYHDTDQQFNAIYNRLNADNEHVEHSQCKIYSRYYSRRRNKEKEQTILNTVYSNNDTLISILDKLHSFYYHSYDTFLRQQFDEEQQSKICSNMVNNINGNKFNSKFNLDHEDTVNDIYSLGQRYEYEEEKHEWFVEPKYKNIQEELLHNKIFSISINSYYAEQGKCKVFMNSKPVKMLMKGILFEHILSLLIYCNCYQYQTKWSATFRKIPNNETDESLKERHSHFYHCSKYLRDIVETFGTKFIHDNGRILYHGVSEIMYFPRTITQFNAPLSASTEMNIALQFSSGFGIILALKYSFSTYPSYAKYFDCAYFSDYVNEKECLLIGGIPMLIITNIVNVSNGERYKEYVNALNVINSVLNGTYKRNSCDYVDNMKAIDLCSSLLLHQLSEETDKNTKYPGYVVKLLNKYCMNLTNITIFWNYIQTEKMRELKEIFCAHDNETFFDLHVLLKLFPNIEQIEYFNESFENKKLMIKKEIKRIIQYIVKYKHDTVKLKYVVIHHETTKLTLNCGYFQNDNNENAWNLYQDKSKLILYKQSANKEEQFDINSINFRFNEIIQGNITQNMMIDLKFSLNATINDVSISKK